MITESLKQEADYNYRYIWLLLIAVTSWGVVPGFAKLGNLGGDITTFYVNWVAVFAVAAIITITGQWQKIRNYTSKQYLIMVALGIAWPLVYSVAYFESVNVGGPALTTILNYSWPLFALFFAHLISRKKSRKILRNSGSFSKRRSCSNLLLQTKRRSRLKPNSTVSWNYSCYNSRVLFLSNGSLEL